MYTIEQDDWFTPAYRAHIFIDAATVQYPLTIKHEFGEQFYFVSAWTEDGRSIGDLVDITCKDSETLIVDSRGDYTLHRISIIAPTHVFEFETDGKIDRFEGNLRDEDEQL